MINEFNPQEFNLGNGNGHQGNGHKAESVSGEKMPKPELAEIQEKMANLSQRMYFVSELLRRDGDLLGKEQLQKIEDEISGIIGELKILLEARDSFTN